MMQTPPEIRLPEFDAETLARACGVTVGTVVFWRHRGLLVNGVRVKLRPTKIGRRVRFSREDVERFLSETARGRSGTDNYQNCQTAPSST